jgi:hypothetical protein
MLRAQQVQPAQQDHLADQLARRARLVYKDLQVLLVQQVQLVHLDQLARKVQLDQHQALQDQQVQQARLDPQVQLVQVLMLTPQRLLLLFQTRLVLAQ